MVRNIQKDKTHEGVQEMLRFLLSQGVSSDQSILFTDSQVVGFEERESARMEMNKMSHPIVIHGQSGAWKRTPGDSMKDKNRGMSEEIHEPKLTSGPMVSSFHTLWNDTVRKPFPDGVVCRVRRTGKMKSLVGMHVVIPSRVERLQDGVYRSTRRRRSSCDGSTLLPFEGE